MDELDIIPSMGSGGGGAKDSILKFVECREYTFVATQDEGVAGEIRRGGKGR